MFRVCTTHRHPRKAESSKGSDTGNDVLVMTRFIEKQVEKFLRMVFLLDLFLISNLSSRSLPITGEP